MSMVAERLGDFAPARQVDLGAGPGTALWAALDCWPMIDAAWLLEGSDSIRRQGEHLIDHAMPATETRPDIAWHAADLANPGQLVREIGCPADADLVTLCYVLDELAPAARQRLIDWAWSHCEGLMLIVEPGTPAGWQRILAARDQLLAAGGRVIAPCLHERPCPLLPANHHAGTWCHFSRRVARSRLHRLAKQADVPWEDEKFIFVAMAQPHLAQGGLAVPDIDKEGATAGRIIAPPRGSSGRIELQLCENDGQQRDRLISKRDGPLYKRARRLDWGDTLSMTASPE
jgi:ribosomal protein RSM22 (predicted rRNA methylase)